MCQRARIDGIEISTAVQLADALNVPPAGLVWIDGEMPYDYSESCLCPVDLEATAKKYGLTCGRDDFADAILGR